jgi:hypothetical protein
MIALATLCLAMVASDAQATKITNLTTGQVLFYDNFENAPNVSHAASPDDTGDYDPVAQIGTWGLPEPETNQNQFQVTDTTASPDIITGACEGDNYLRLYNAGGRAYAPFTPQSTVGDVIRMETMISLNSEMPNANGGPWTAWDTAGKPIISGNFSYYGPATSTAKYGLAASRTDVINEAFGVSWDITNGEWFFFALEYAVGATTFSLEIGEDQQSATRVNGLVLRYDGYLPGSPTANITSFAFGSGAGAGKQLYLDAVPVPEPSAALLLVLGAVCLTGFKRAR